MSNAIKQFPVKPFRLKDPKMTNEEIAKELGIGAAKENKKDFCSENGRRHLGKRVSKEIFNIVVDMADDKDFHQKLMEIAQEEKCAG
jgi:hypothetical protein